jgi:hypothetical protein
MAQNIQSVTGNPISLIFPRCSSTDDLQSVLTDVHQFFSKWPTLPEIFVPFLPLNTKFLRKDLQLLSNAGLGYGAAVKEGVKKSKADFSFVLDLPLEYPFADVFNSWMEFESNPDIDIVVGSRRLPESSRLSEPPGLYWKIDSWLNDRLHQTSEFSIRDVTGSFYCFRNKKVRVLTDDIYDTGYSFSARLVRKAQQNRLRVVEKPAHWNPSRDIWKRGTLDHWNLFKMTFM